MFSVRDSLEQLAIPVVQARQEQPRTHLLRGLIWLLSILTDQDEWNLLFSLKSPSNYMVVGFCLPMRSKLKEWLVLNFQDYTALKSTDYLYYFFFTLTSKIYGCCIDLS